MQSLLLQREKWHDETRVIRLRYELEGKTDAFRRGVEEYPEAEVGE